MIKLLLITGGCSTEHEIAKMSCTNIKKQIDTSKYDVSTLGITKEGKWYELSSDISDYSNEDWLNNAKEVVNTIDYLKRYDVVFPVLHGKNGEDGTIQGLLELANVPYVGCKVLASALAMDKVVTKKLLQTANIKQVPSLYIKQINKDFVVVNSDCSLDKNVLDRIINDISLPCFIKASRSGSSFGCFKVDEAKKILKYLNDASKYDNKILVEKAINAKELECAVLGNNTDILCSRVGEILPHGEFYTYKSKYEDKKSKTLIPANITFDQEEYIKSIAKKAFITIDGSGLARIDFFLDKDTNDIYLNEINTMPGFTDISMYPELINNLNISTAELIDRLISLALEK